MPYDDALDLRYDTLEVLEAVENIQPQATFLIDTFFPTIQLSKSTSWEFDIRRKKRRIAPYVAPVVESKPMLSEGFHTRSIRAAYVKPAETIEPQETDRRLPGEAYGGALSPQQRLDILINEKIEMNDDMITHRLEEQASQLLTTGQIIIDGEDYERTVVNMGLSPSLVVNLVGAASWATPTATVSRDVQTIAKRIAKLSGGKARIIVTSGDTFDMVSNYPDLRNLMDNNVRNGDGSTTIDQNPRLTNSAQRVARFSSGIEWWTYDECYTNDAGVEVPFLPNNVAVVGCDGSTMQGTQLFGKIQDFEAIRANGGEFRHFARLKEEGDPSVLKIWSQSAPIVYPKMIDTWGIVKW